VDIFYPSAGAVFSKEGVFQQPQAFTLVDHGSMTEMAITTINVVTISGEDSQASNKAGAFLL
jgi:hypothetical protein